MKEIKSEGCERDYDLDLYRGWVMLYIVGCVHVVSSIFINWHRDTWATLFLIEMPVIFYISGASYTLSKRKPYMQYLLNRLKRIAIPLLIYLLIYLIDRYISGNIGLKEMPGEFIRYCEAILTNRPTELSHLWFIRPYFIIALLLPLMHHMSQRVNRYTIYPLLLVAMVALYFHPDYVLCYIIPTFAGLYYRRQAPYNSYLILIVMLCTIALCHRQGFGWNMQFNKFPSNAMFLAYATSVLIMLHRPLKWCCRQAARVRLVRYIVMEYAHHSYTIYLYHIHVIALILYIYTLMDTHQPFDPFHTLTACIFTSVGTVVIMIPAAHCIDYVNMKVESLVCVVGRSIRGIVSSRTGSDNK